jgi:hypothetical protein
VQSSVSLRPILLQKGIAVALCHIPGPAVGGQRRGRITADHPG